MTTKNMEARREAFETWAISTIGKQSSEDYPEWAIEKNRFGSYASIKVEGAWIGYNAALDSICVEVPDSSELVGDYGREIYRIARDEFMDALEAAGVPYK